MPWTPWRSRSFRLDEDQVRSTTQVAVPKDPHKNQSWSNQSKSNPWYVKQDHWTMRTIPFSLLSTNRVCLIKKRPQIAHASHVLLWGDSFGRGGVRGDFENLWNILKTHEPLCEQQCDQFCTKPDLRMCPVAMALLHDNAGLFSYGDAVYPPLRDAHFPDMAW